METSQANECTSYNNDIYACPNAISDMAASALDNQVSLNKAAHLLGVNEINNFDYKSLNSIRKLAKTLGCNEYELMKSFNNPNVNSADSNSLISSQSNTLISGDKQQIVNENVRENAIDPVDPASLSKQALQNTKKLSLSKAHTKFDSVTSNSKSQKEDKNAANNSNSSTNEHKGFSFLLVNKNSKSKSNSLKDILVDTEKSQKSKSDSLGAKEPDVPDRPFKRTIINKKLPSRLYQKSAKNKQTNGATAETPEAKPADESVSQEKSQESDNVLVVDDKPPQKPPKDAEAKATESKIEPEINQKKAEPEPREDSSKIMNSSLINNALNDAQNGISQKREITLIKDEHLGFGFIAGSEKPLVIRFVSPDGPGKNKLLNGDEILSINDEDVQFASREYVIDLIRNSSNKIRMTVKQPTPKSNNSLLLTEDKKAFKKSTQYNKNKVRFRLDKDQPASDSESNNNNETSENESPYANEIQPPPKIYSNHEEVVKSMSQNASLALNSYNELEIPFYQAYNIYQDPSAVSKDKLNAVVDENAAHEFNANSSIAIKTLLTTIMSANPNLEAQNLEESSTDTQTPPTTSKKTMNDYLYGHSSDSTNYQLVNKESHATSNSAPCEDNTSSILKVYLENKIVKSFKYDKNTCVRDVLACLKEKLDIKFIDYFGLVVKLYDDCSISKFVLLEETRYLHQIKQAFGSDADFKCLFRFIFVPCNIEMLIFNDHNAFNYLYEQSCNDVLLEGFGSELKYEMILHLATLSILHDYASRPESLSYESASSMSAYSSSNCSLQNNPQISKPKLDLNFIENDYALEKYLPKSLLDSNVLKRKDLKRLLNQNLDWFFEKNFLNKDDIKSEYLKCMNELLQFSGRIYLVTLIDQMKESFIIIGANYGIATFLDVKTKTLLNLAKFESIENIRVTWHSQMLIRIDLDLFDSNSLNNEIIHKTISFGFLKDDYLSFLYLLQGYLRIYAFPSKNRLCPIQEIKTMLLEGLNIPVFLVKYPVANTNKRGQENSNYKNQVAKYQTNTCCIKASTASKDGSNIIHQSSSTLLSSSSNQSTSNDTDENALTHTIELDKTPTEIRMHKNEIMMPISNSYALKNAESDSSVNKVSFKSSCLLSPQTLSLNEPVRRRDTSTRNDFFNDRPNFYQPNPGYQKQRLHDELFDKFNYHTADLSPSNSTFETSIRNSNSNLLSSGMKDSTSSLMNREDFYSHPKGLIKNLRSSLEKREEHEPKAFNNNIYVSELKYCEESMTPSAAILNKEYLEKKPVSESGGRQLLINLIRQDEAKDQETPNDISHITEEDHIIEYDPNTNELTSTEYARRIILKSINPSINTESLPLIESFQLVNQNDVSDLRPVEENSCHTQSSSDSQNTNNDADFDVDQSERNKKECEFLIKSLTRSSSELNKRIRNPNLLITASLRNKTASLFRNDQDNTNMESEEGEEVKSISSIEGSLKGLSVNSNYDFDEHSTGLSSSTPLTHLYPKLESDELASQSIPENPADANESSKNTLKKFFYNSQLKSKAIRSLVKEEDSTSTSSSQSSSTPPSPVNSPSKSFKSLVSSVNFVTACDPHQLVFSYKPSEPVKLQSNESEEDSKLNPASSEKDTPQEQEPSNAQQDLNEKAKPETESPEEDESKRKSRMDFYNPIPSASSFMPKSFSAAAAAALGDKVTQIGFNELDVIDLTQYQNQSILVAPPPLQFSDDYPNNQVKLNDLEIESGIESDSSADQQQVTDSKDLSNKLNNKSDKHKLEAAATAANPSNKTINDTNQSDLTLKSSGNEPADTKLSDSVKKNKKFSSKLVINCGSTDRTSSERKKTDESSLERKKSYLAAGDTNDSSVSQVVYQTKINHYVNAYLNNLNENRQRSNSAKPAEPKSYLSNSYRHQSVPPKPNPARSIDAPFSAESSPIKRSNSVAHNISGAANRIPADSTEISSEEPRITSSASLSLRNKSSTSNNSQSDLDKIGSLKKFNISTSHSYLYKPPLTDSGLTTSYASSSSSSSVSAGVPAIISSNNSSPTSFSQSIPVITSSTNHAQPGIPSGNQTPLVKTIAKNYENTGLLPNKPRLLKENSTSDSIKKESPTVSSGMPVIKIIKGSSYKPNGSVSANSAINIPIEYKNESSTDDFSSRKPRIAYNSFNSQTRGTEIKISHNPRAEDKTYVSKPEELEENPSNSRKNSLLLDSILESLKMTHSYDKRSFSVDNPQSRSVDNKQPLMVNSAYASSPAKNNSYENEDFINGYIIGRIQNESSLYKPLGKVSNSQAFSYSSSTSSNEEEAQNGSGVKVTIPKSLTSQEKLVGNNVDENCKIFTSHHQLISPGRNFGSQNLNTSCSNLSNISDTSERTGEQGSKRTSRVIHKVLGKLVETSKSKLPYHNSSTNNSTFELINGFDEAQPTSPSKTDQKQKKKSLSYKIAETSTRSFNNLFKSHSQNHEEESADMRKSNESIHANSASIEIPSINLTPSSKSKSRSKTKSYSKSSSLPSRNFRVVDDIKHLFDKFTHSNKTASTSAKVASTNLNTNLNTARTSFTKINAAPVYQSPIVRYAPETIKTLPIEIETGSFESEFFSALSSKYSPVNNETQKPVFAEQPSPSPPKMTLIKSISSYESELASPSRKVGRTGVVKLKTTQQQQQQPKSDEVENVTININPPATLPSGSAFEREPISYQSTYLKPYQLDNNRVSSSITVNYVDTGSNENNSRQEIQSSDNSDRKWPEPEPEKEPVAARKPVSLKRTDSNSSSSSSPMSSPAMAQQNGSSGATSNTTSTFKPVSVLKQHTSARPSQSSYSSSDLDIDSPDSPRKGSLKKQPGLIRDSSATRSALKVRWKDMIEVSNFIEDGDDEGDNDDGSDEPDEYYCLEPVGDDSTQKVNGVGSSPARKPPVAKTDEQTEDRSEDAKGSPSKAKRELTDKDSLSSDIIVTSEKKFSSRKVEGKQLQLDLKPLHATGKQFEKEMLERIAKLNAIKSKTHVDEVNEKFYDEIHRDLDDVLFELHSTIEHVRLSSMNSMNNPKVTSNDELDQAGENQPEKGALSSSKSKLYDMNIEEKIADVAIICRQFVNNSKSMISSALVNVSEVKPHIRHAMNSLCSLVVQCLETSYNYLYKNKKLDETRQVLIQILNLLNTFRTTLNITYLAASKQLNDTNMNLLMKQATNLASEISLLIKDFKLLF